HFKRRISTEMILASIISIIDSAPSRLSGPSIIGIVIIVEQRSKSAGAGRRAIIVNIIKDRFHGCLHGFLSQSYPAVKQRPHLSRKRRDPSIEERRFTLIFQHWNAELSPSDLPDSKSRKRRRTDRRRRSKQKIAP